MVTKPDVSKIAAQLVGGKPIDFKLYPDGSLGVIAPTGQKFVFTPEQVEQERIKQTPQPTPKPSKTPRKAVNKK